MIRKLFLYLLITYTSVFSQSNTWYKVYDVISNSWASGILETNDGGLLVTGKMMASAHDQDIFLIRANKEGDVVWYHTYGDTGVWDDVFSLEKTLNNEYLMASNTGSLIKIDDSGNTLWSKQYSDIGTHASIQQTSDNKFIIAFSKNVAPNTDSVGLMKIDQEGNKLWSKSYDIGYSWNSVQTSDGGYALLYNKIYAGESIFSLIITDSVGNMVLKKDYTEFISFSGNTIQRTNDNGFIICASDNYNTHIYLIKIDKDGTVQWSNSVEGYLNYNYQLLSLKQNNNPGYVIAAYKNRHTLIYNLSDSGKVIWAKYFEGTSIEEIPSAIITTKDNGYYICGYTFNNEVMLYQTMVIKTDSAGSNLADNLTSVNEATTKIKTYSVSQNYPNPFNPTTKIEYSIPKASYVSLKVYDLLGREVALLVNEEKNAGGYEAKFDGSKLTSGIYFYKIQAGSYTSVKKMILVK